MRSLSSSILYTIKISGKQALIKRQRKSLISIAER